MANDDLRNLDLNLVRTLDALLHERNVSRAARRLGIGQPAASAGLARLRRHFHDELLYRSGNRYELTPLADQLLGRTAHAMAGVRRVFDASPDFDPSSAEREFAVLVSDYAAAVLGDHLATLARREAPGVRFRFEQQTTYAVDHAAEVLRTIDGCVMPRGFLTDLPSRELYEDTWVLVASKDNDRIDEEVTLSDLAVAPWVVTFNRPTAFTPAVRQLRMIGVEPRVDIVVESFLAVPFLVSGTDRIALLQRQIATRLRAAADIRILECPWDVVPLKEAFWWHPTHRSDPGHAWLRDLVARAGREVNS